MRRDVKPSIYSSLTMCILCTRKLTISLLHRYHVGGGTTLNDRVAHQVATLGHHSYQLRHT